MATAAAVLPKHRSGQVGDFTPVATLERSLDGSVGVTGIACGHSVHLVGRDPNIKPGLRHLKTLGPTAEQGSDTAGGGARMCARCVCFSPDARTMFVAEAPIAKHALSSLCDVDLAPLTAPAGGGSCKPPSDNTSIDDNGKDIVLKEVPPKKMLMESMSRFTPNAGTSAPTPRVVAYDTDTVQQLADQAFPWHLADNEGGLGDASEPVSPALGGSPAGPPGSMGRRASAPTCLAAAPTGAELACGTDNGTLRVWALDGGHRGVPQRLRYKQCLVGGAATDVSFSLDGRFIVAVTEHGGHALVLRAVDGTSVTEIALDRGLSTVTAGCVAFLPPSHVMTSHFEGVETDLTPKGGRLSVSGDYMPLTEDEMPSSLDIAVGCSDGFVRVFNVARRRLIVGVPAAAATVAPAQGTCRGPPSQHTRPANANPSRILSISCDATGGRIAATSADGVISVFSAAGPTGTSSSVHTWRNVFRLPRCVQLSGDGRRLVVGTDRGSVELLDATGRPELHALGNDHHSHTGRVTTATYSPDMRLVATVGADGSLSVLGVADVRRAASVTLPLAPRSLSFADDALVATVDDGRAADQDSDSCEDSADGVDAQQRPSVRTVNVFGSLSEKEFEAAPGNAAGGCGACMHCSVM